MFWTCDDIRMMLCIKTDVSNMILFNKLQKQFIVGLFSRGIPKDSLFFLLPLLEINWGEIDQTRNNCQGKWFVEINKQELPYLWNSTGGSSISSFHDCWLVFDFLKWNMCMIKQTSKSCCWNSINFLILYQFRTKHINCRWDKIKEIGKGFQ
jgi:hypothetical protein